MKIINKKTVLIGFMLGMLLFLAGCKKEEEIAKVEVDKTEQGIISVDREGNELEETTQTEIVQNTPSEGIEQPSEQFPQQTVTEEDLLNADITDIINQIIGITQGIYSLGDIQVANAERPYVDKLKSYYISLYGPEQDSNYVVLLDNTDNLNILIESVRGTIVFVPQPEGEDGQGDTYENQAQGNDLDYQNQLIAEINNQIAQGNIRGSINEWTLTDYIVREYINPVPEGEEDIYSMANDVRVIESDNKLLIHKDNIVLSQYMTGTADYITYKGIEFVVEELEELQDQRVLNNNNPVLDTLTAEELTRSESRIYGNITSEDSTVRIEYAIEKEGNTVVDVDVRVIESGGFGWQ